MSVLDNFWIFSTALGFSLLMVPMLRRWAIERQICDIPDQRKVHVEPTPRLGGVAIFISVLFALLAFTEVNQQIRGLLSGGLVLFMTGLIDDLYGLSPKNKFMGQILACIVTMVVGDLLIVELGNLFGMGHIVLPLWLAFPFTLFAVVGVINSLNMLDGLDGLAGGFAVIALGAFLLLGGYQGQISTVALCLALLGGLFGFLKYNSHPAVIFMGDSGSLSVGFFLGFLAVMLTQQPGATVQPVVPLVILGLPIFDTLRVMGKRVCKGKSPFAPDKIHVHHKLLDLGLNHRFAVIGIYGLTLFWAAFALIFRTGAEHILLASYLVSMSGIYLAFRLLARYKEALVLPVGIRIAGLFSLDERFSSKERPACESPCAFREEGEGDEDLAASCEEQCRAA